MKYVISSTIRSNHTLIAGGTNIEDLDAFSVDSPTPFYFLENADRARFTKESNLIIRRSKLSFLGAYGLRPGLLFHNTGFPARAAIVYKLPQSIMIADNVLQFSDFNQWQEVNVSIPVYGDNFEFGLNSVSGQYDSIGINSIFNGINFEVVVSLEVEGIKL